MKKIITLALSAFLLCTHAEAQKNFHVINAKHAENFYVIDGKHIEDFDGSQLIGKTIKHYDMKVLPNTTIHNIFTTDDWVKITGTKTATTAHVLTKEEAEARGLPITSSSMKAFMENPLIIVDGEEFTGSLYEFGVDNIDYIDVYEPDDEVAKSYGEKGKNGVIKMFTRKQQDAVIYVINGKSASKQDFNNLSHDDIKKIKVLKRGTAAALKVTPEGKTNDIYLITTTKSK